MTGASSGFGLEMSRCALEHGDRVVATLRDPSALVDLASKYSSAQLLVAKVDVTNHDEIKAAFRRAKDAFGRVDIVFNNAGYVLTGEAETTPEELAKKLFEVDFWGAVRVSQEAVRFFREDNNPQGGYLIQNSAAAGIAAFPALGFYTAAKHGKSLFSIDIYTILTRSIRSLGRLHRHSAQGIRSCMEHQGIKSFSGIVNTYSESLVYP